MKAQRHNRLEKEGKWRSAFHGWAREKGGGSGTGGLDFAQGGTDVVKEDGGRRYYRLGKKRGGAF